MAIINSLGKQNSLVKSVAKFYDKIFQALFDVEYAAA